MASPRYKSRSHYRTRHSASERNAVPPSKDFGATSLDRPKIDFSALPPIRLPKTEPALRPRRGRAPKVAWFAFTVLMACAFGGVVFGALLGLVRCS